MKGRRWFSLAVHAYPESESRYGPFLPRKRLPMYWALQPVFAQASINFSPITGLVAGGKP